MSSLSDSVDRICLLAKNIRLNAASCASETAGPFTKAVLHAPLGDLIRDIDPAELGLFTLVAPSKQVPDVDNTGASTSEITRAEFHGATPLKKPPVPKPGRHNPQRPGEHEPEVYARAAIKYLDRYQSIRPMPRAAEQATRITEHLDVVRESMRKLNDELKQHATADACSPPASPKATIRQEEKRIREAQARIRELRKRKDALLKQRASARIATPKARPNLQTPPPADAQEETFWNTPAASARTLHFTGESLLDEHVDVGDISGVSFASPLPVRSSIQSLPRLAVAEDDEPETQLEPDIAELESMDDGKSMGSVDGPPEDEVEEEQTVVMRQPPPGGAVDVPDEVAEAALEPASEPPPVAETHGVARSSKVRVTTELEHIVHSKLDVNKNPLCANVKFPNSPWISQRNLTFKRALACLRQFKMTTISSQYDNASGGENLSVPTISRWGNRPSR
ncbi:hypothetical protein POSPLADRAFT_1132375 [Postia placenta MAD-698-R-SB12]|uniref:Uncharacterized protein n=1 Tax=Postia placenta MAD-698-R-SB12 TaxID=670580 RepID=A0A1X6NDF7_9APHY|nr:hypothetical protein POSPLADRAFT_1132375 [Postia placenta MAD-698-R-SB12]OSX66651.1 hypothetical protein POSPLADRAFT_1132375 [Postia placenta MAD-698-R-SB12]